MIKYRMRMWKSSFKNKQKRWIKKNICNKKLHGFQSIHPADDSDDYEPFLQNGFFKDSLLDAINVIAVHFFSNAHFEFGIFSKHS